jgi:aminoglycoside/choline kinase family phosphotransferase
MPTDAILTTARKYLGVDPTVPVSLQPIKRGASGRTIVRVKSPGREPFIGIHWTDERPDSGNFVPVARFLKRARLNVPEILHDNWKRRVALVEDLGEDDLLSMKDRPFAEREPIYRSALSQVDRLFYAKQPKELDLMPPFDAALYQWEQRYFIERFVEDLLCMHGTKLDKNPAMISLAERLGASARHLVHRDFQSQNIMVRGTDAWLIDFQGMRRGRQEYDLASLLYDPYLNHDAAGRERLLGIWEEITEDRPEESILRECAAQRLMQALGAFGNILMNRGDDWYRQHIPVAARLLEGVVAGTDLEKPLAPVIARATET